MQDSKLRFKPFNPRLKLMQVIIARLPTLWHGRRNTSTIGDNLGFNIQKPGEQHHITRRKFTLVFPEFVHLLSGKRQNPRNVIPR